MCFGELGPELARLNWNSRELGPALNVCEQSWKARNGETAGVVNNWARYAVNAQTACARVLRAFSLKGPSSMMKCRVLLVWLAMLLDPVTCNLETPCLAKAFVTISSNEKGHPIHQNVDHDQRKWEFNPENPEHVLPKILLLDTKFNEEEKDTDLFTFIQRHASSEVSFILERYLPTESADKLRERLLAADLLAVPVSDEAEESEAAEDASQEDTRVEPNGKLTKPDNSSNDDVTDQRGSK